MSGNGCGADFQGDMTKLGVKVEEHGGRERSGIPKGFGISNCDCYYHSHVPSTLIPSPSPTSRPLTTSTSTWPPAPPASNSSPCLPPPDQQERRYEITKMTLRMRSSLVCSRSKRRRRRAAKASERRTSTGVGLRGCVKRAEKQEEGGEVMGRVLGILLSWLWTCRSSSVSKVERCCRLERTCESESGLQGGVADSKCVCRCW